MFLLYSLIKKDTTDVSLTVSPTLCESVRFCSLHFCIHLAVCLSFCISSSLFFWPYSVVTGLTKVSLCAPQSVRLSARLCLSPSFSGVTPFWHYYCDSVPICLSLSEFLSIYLSSALPCPRLMLFVCDRSRLNPCVSVSVVFLFPAAVVFHQSDAGSAKAVHLSIAGDEHHVPVNTRPLVMLSHLVSSSLQSCYSLLIFLQILKKFQEL